MTLTEAIGTRKIVATRTVSVPREDGTALDLVMTVVRGNADLTESVLLTLPGGDKVMAYWNNNSADPQTSSYAKLRENSVFLAAHKQSCRDLGFAVAGD
jgi:hypothetical protein